MPRAEDHEEAVDQIIISGGKPHHGTLLDPRAAMPGAVKRVGGDVPTVDEHGPVGDKAELRRRYFEYVHHLAHPAKEYADLPVESRVAPALAQTFGITLEEAEHRQVELHDALANAARSTTFGDALRKKDVDVNARVARAADFLYSPNPKIALVALKILNDMDEGATQSQEETIEDHIASLLEETG